MQTELSCICGEVIRGDSSNISIKCSHCGRVYVLDSEEDDEVTTRIKPLVETAPARIFAWGCLMPIAFALLLFGINRLVLQESTLASYLIAGGVLLFSWIAYILHRNGYSNAKLMNIAAALVVLQLALSWQTLWAFRQESKLSGMFAEPIKEFSVQNKVVRNTPLILTEKVLPIVLTERGATTPRTMPRVFVDIFNQLPADLRPERPEDVHTVIVVDWFYERTGIYQTVEVLKEKVSNIYCGGCTIKIVDRDSHSVIHVHEIKLPDGAPKERPGDFIESWYGPQPSEKDVLEYILNIKHQKR